MTIESVHPPLEQEASLQLRTTRTYFRGPGCLANVIKEALAASSSTAKLTSQGGPVPPGASRGLPIAEYGYPSF
ncbi:hypothetical protein FRB95_000434 [Tulasnella sp. JGI-2019a]|nr:hypothetical protein FRB95_000434 [Tulasnella sp. JGI-2019a]